ncbi:SDR family NAD(P)-dependent oxidoreductase [Microlunatus sp. Y2014]|uniref:SDR family NAD(P)-dependent oxidoreductase n=1 Tax=Microlunatus sp. Y2014 TaxID=3418488 RepID=UPI003DA77074
MPTALITGATSGIGAEFATQLAARGDDLVIVARDEARLSETAERLRATYGVDVEVLPADLADRDRTTLVAERLASVDRPIDLLVNNAGFGMHKRLLDPDVLPELDHALEVMLRAVFQLGGAAGRAMRLRGSGAIVNVSSTAMFVSLGSYSAIKSAVTAYSESLAVELAGSGVTVTALCPGWVRTEFHERAGIGTSKIPGAAWIDAPDLVRGAIRDTDRGKLVSVPTAKWKVAIAVARVAPRSMIKFVSSKIKSGR